MPDGFSIGPLHIRFYGIVLMLGALAGAWLTTREVKRRGYDPEIVWDLFMYLLVGGIVGARLWHVFTPSPSALVQDLSTGKMVNPYFAGGTIHILDILAIWKGGLGIPGAIIGGVTVLYFYTRRHELNFAEWLDMIAPALALGQAIGRWGNYFNQELYGKATTLPWGIYIEKEKGYFHPLFLYESIWNLCNMFFLLWISKRYPDRLKPGDVFLVYLIVYPVGRFFLDFLRVDASLIGGININQTVMAVTAVVSAFGLYWRHRK